MRLSNTQYRDLLNSFLIKWPLEKVRTMTLEEYVSLGNSDSFCHWIEYETNELGTISGRSAVIYGIYEMKTKNFEDKAKYLSNDGKYRWNNKFGKNKNEAFENIKKHIINVIENTYSKNYSAIEDNPLDSFWKWKIAYLYSNEQLYPFFKKELLLFASQEIGGNFNIDSKTSDIQIFLTQHRPLGQTVFEFSNKIWDIYNSIYSKTKRFFIVGTRYGSKLNVLDKMVKKEVISTGFAPNENISFLYLKTQEKIKKVLDKKLTNYSEKSAAISTFTNLLKMKPGDMIALKSTGQPQNGKAYLEIIGYATVVEIDGNVYSYDDDLGHCINVKFIDTKIKRAFELGGYSRTIHDITDSTDIVKLIFKGNESISNINVKAKLKRRRRRDGRKIFTGKQRRKGSAPYVADSKHNQIQEKFIKSLIREYGKDNVKTEEDFVDIKLIGINGVTLFEVKPFFWAEDCIKSALGQIITYSFFNYDKGHKKLRVIGPNPPDDEEKKIISYLKNNMKFDFDYEFFPMD